VAYANNGFIWGGNPSVDFGMPGPMGVADPSCAYFRRELVIWGDCVKLRYGAKPEDSPWLWNLMRTYTEQMARLFHGKADVWVLYVFGCNSGS
jgi:glycogen debranching enzyme